MMGFIGCFIVGCVVDTNQFTSSVIYDECYARYVIDKIVLIYGESILDHLYLTNHGTSKCYSSFAVPSSFTLLKKIVMSLDKRFIGKIELVPIRLSNEFEYRKEIRLFGIVLRRECWRVTDIDLDGFYHTNHYRSDFDSSFPFFIGENNVIYKKARIVIWNNRNSDKSGYMRLYSAIETLYFKSDSDAKECYDRLNSRLRETGNMIDLE